MIIVKKQLKDFKEKWQNTVLDEELNLHEFAKWCGYVKIKNGKKSLWIRQSDADIYRRGWVKGWKVAN